MTLPFTAEQFLDVFRQYNTSIWPAQILLVLVALALAGLALRGVAGRTIGFGLAALWAWTGMVYHWTFFARINPAARGFAVLWVAGAAAFAINAVRGRALTFLPGSRWRRATGLGLIVYALAVYPILGHFDGRAYPFAPTFGAPCPVTIATFGILWLASPPIPRPLVIAPLVWAAIGSSAAFALGVREDLGLLVAGLSGVLLLMVNTAPRPVTPPPDVVKSA